MTRAAGFISGGFLRLYKQIETAVRVKSLSPDVLVMQPADEGATRCVRAAGPGKRLGHPGPMTDVFSPSIISQDPARMPLAQHHDVVHALATDRSDQ
jgi:hypothetical protein